MSEDIKEVLYNISVAHFKHGRGGGGDTLGIRHIQILYRSIRCKDQDKDMRNVYSD